MIASYHSPLSEPLVRLTRAFGFRILPCTSPHVSKLQSREEPLQTFAPCDPTRPTQTPNSPPLNEKPSPMSSSTYKSCNKHQIKPKPSNKPPNAGAWDGPGHPGERRGARKGGASGGGGGGRGEGRRGSAGRRAAAPWEAGGCHGESDSVGVLEGDGGGAWRG